MALTYSETTAFGAPAPSFSLPGVDGGDHRLEQYLDGKGLVIVFMCNHCPYVKAVQGRINQLARDYAPHGIRLIGINSNDTVKYPADNFDAMKLVAKEQGYLFPYLLDEDQAVARAYGAVCTPDFYVYRVTRGRTTLEYRGRLDDSWKDEAAVRQRELAQALDLILAGKPVPQGPDDQKPSMGCSIKWK